MKKYLIALVIGHVLTAGYALVYLYDKKLAVTKANYFLRKTAVPDGIELIWYYKLMSIYLLFCITYICFAWVAAKTNRKLFLCISVFGIYHLLDFVMFLIDFSQSWWMYIVFGLLITVAIVFIMMPIKEKAKVVSME